MVGGWARVVIIYCSVTSMKLSTLILTQLCGMGTSIPIYWGRPRLSKVICPKFTPSEASKPKPNSRVHDLCTPPSTWSWSIIGARATASPESAFTQIRER